MIGVLVWKLVPHISKGSQPLTELDREVFWLSWWFVSKDYWFCHLWQEMWFPLFLPKCSATVSQASSCSKPTLKCYYIKYRTLKKGTKIRTKHLHYNPCLEFLLYLSHFMVLLWRGISESLIGHFKLLNSTGGLFLSLPTI